LDKLETTSDLTSPAPATSGLRTPQDKDSRLARRLQVEHYLLAGLTYREIEVKAKCSPKLIASVSKEINQRLTGDAESIKGILKTRMLSTASKALTKVTEAIDGDDCDAKELLSIFNSTYDKATGAKDSAQETNVHISLANMFSLPTATEVAEVTEVDAVVSDAPHATTTATVD